MKNHRIEQLHRLARQYHRNRRGDSFEQGILLRHYYGEVDPHGLSWWDDVMFVHGKVRINVAWQHPRNVYQGMIEEAAMKATAHLSDKIEGDMFSDAEKTYAKLGRRRKKVLSYTTVRRPGEDEWFAALRAEEERLSAAAEFAATPSFKVETLDWCRFVGIVAPVEVRQAGELRALADLVRRILKGEATLEAEFPGYVYGKAQWVADGLAGRPLYPVSHRIAGT
ncbi:MAG: hypothetical protein EFKGCFLK_01882 [Rhodocyclaceae bacterium]|nr:MAG: hypothetical protein F9K21_10935 [Rhodocyclaceae bacterium]MBV6408296.1 hypothetical protein [Rhodocyclaceae bacterium]CAG0931559.1 hypothetical protein RHDC3_01908 [Rhodocyclaceae bacterium]